MLDELIRAMLDQMPNMIGLVITIVILYRQNETLMLDVLRRLDDLEETLEHLGDTK